MKKLFAVSFIIMIAFCISCTDARNAKRILNEQGYSQVEMTGYSWFGCSQDDFFHTGFRAKNQNGQFVDGTVCSGIFFKNSTIRFK